MTTTARRVSGIAGLEGVLGGGLALRRDGGARLLRTAITGFGQRLDREQAVRAGVDHYLLEPADVNRLHRLLALSPPPSA